MVFLYIDKIEPDYWLGKGLILTKSFLLLINFCTLANITRGARQHVGLRTYPGT